MLAETRAFLFTVTGTCHNLKSGYLSPFFLLCKKQQFEEKT